MTIKMTITVQIISALLIASLVSTSPVINNPDQQPSTNLDKSEVKNIDGVGFTKYNYDDSEEIGYQFAKREAAESTGPLDQPLVWGARLEKPVEAAAPVTVDVKPGQKIEWALNLNDKKFYSNNDGLDQIEQKKEDSSSPGEASKVSSESYDPIKGILPAVLTDKRRLGEDDMATTTDSDAVASSPSKASPGKGEAHKPRVKTVVKAFAPGKNVPQHVFTDDQFPALIKIKGRQYLVIPHQADSTPSSSYVTATSPWHLNHPGQWSALYGAPGQVQQQAQVPYPFFAPVQASPSPVKVQPQATSSAQSFFGGYPVGGHQAPVAPNFAVYKPVQSSVSVGQSVESDAPQSTVPQAAALAVPVPVEGKQQAVVGQVSTGQTVGVMDQTPSVQSAPVFPGFSTFGQSAFAVQSAPGQSFGLASQQPFIPGPAYQSFIASTQKFARDFHSAQPFAQSFGQHSPSQYPGQSILGHRIVYVVPSHVQPVQQSVPMVTSVSSSPSFAMMPGQTSAPSSWGMRETPSKTSSVPSSWGMHDQPSVASSWGMGHDSAMKPSPAPSNWPMRDQTSVPSSWGMHEPSAKPSSVSPPSESTQSDVHSSSWGMTSEASASQPAKPSKVHPVGSVNSDSKDQASMSTNGVKGVQSAPSVSMGSVSTSDQAVPDHDKKAQPAAAPAMVAEQANKDQPAPVVSNKVEYQYQVPHLVPTVSSFTIHQQQQASSSPYFSPLAGYQQIHQVAQAGQSTGETFQGYQSTHPFQSSYQIPLQSIYQAPFTAFQTPIQSYYPQIYSRIVSLPSHQNGLKFLPTSSYNTYTVHTKLQ